MKIDEKEMREVTASAAPRLDMYAGIHKALRALMADTLLAVGRMDCADELEFAQVTQRVVEMLDVLRQHLAHENRFVHPALEARVPGASQRIADEHVEHEHHIAELAQALEALRAQPAASRGAAAYRLYQSLSVFIAGNLEHMHLEETAHNAALWSHYSDDELAAIHNALVASIPPQEMMYVMRWMLPYMNPAERAGMLAEMRAHAPAPAFQAVINTARPHLTPGEWDKLAKALAL